MTGKMSRSFDYGTTYCTRSSRYTFYLQMESISILSHDFHIMDHGCIPKSRLLFFLNHIVDNLQGLATSGNGHLGADVVGKIIDGGGIDQGERNVVVVVGADEGTTAGLEKVVETILGADVHVLGHALHARCGLNLVGEQGAVLGGDGDALDTLGSVEGEGIGNNFLVLAGGDDVVGGLVGHDTGDDDGLLGVVGGHDNHNEGGGAHEDGHEKTHQHEGASQANLGDELRERALDAEALHALDVILHHNGGGTVRVGVLAFHFEL